MEGHLRFIFPKPKKRKKKSINIRGLNDDNKKKNIALEKSSGVYFEGANNLLSIKSLGAKKTLSSHVERHEKVSKRYMDCYDLYVHELLMKTNTKLQGNFKEKKNIVNKINIILFLESILNCFNVLKEGDESSSLSIKLSGNL